ncbi:AbrB/MazE/SpoVT family DNA-binding domain-containing protein [Aquirufa nivalisilvae]|uniref:AbrB/MazE/SpoVT family DNA-binding domain-containing protein n=1 Tax=Aquirufa nivalisilvae TaxID=2516557 RepID=UPI001032FA78|nr:AbrB/MazE/SpoVT family DNA-binding domain-containing protein [Aquirufa nivalisilvae]TBH76515.1 AbrB/MazE/SpoVT family DNA-binding domain-containing protein [Aquirufa nivalisilvae]
MKISIIPIGNSKGIRLSKTMLEKYQIEDSIELILQEDCIVLKPIQKARKGWTEAFRQMSENQEDQLLIPDVFEDESLEAWK